VGRGAGKGAHRVRIVGGQWKRTPLAVPDVPGLRPTPDRVRETLFNWLGQSLEGRACLDPFAGSGVLGLEAASRGARRVVMVERDRTAVAAIRAAIERLHADVVELVAGDAFETLRRLGRAGERFDLVFLDPPFGQGLLEQALPLVGPLLAPGARVYVEADMTHAGMAPATATASEVGDGTYRADDLVLGMAGDWIVSVKVTTAGGVRADGELLTTVRAR